MRGADRSCALRSHGGLIDRDGAVRGCGIVWVRLRLVHGVAACCQRILLAACEMTGRQLTGRRAARRRGGKKARRQQSEALRIEASSIGASQADGRKLSTKPLPTKARSCRPRFASLDLPATVLATVLASSCWPRSHFPGSRFPGSRFPGSCWPGAFWIKAYAEGLCGCLRFMQGPSLWWSCNRSGWHRASAWCGCGPRSLQEIRARGRPGSSDPRRRGEGQQAKYKRILPGSEIIRRA